MSEGFVELHVVRVLRSRSGGRGVEVIGASGRIPGALVRGRAWRTVLLIWFGFIVAIPFLPAFACVLGSLLQVPLGFLRGFFGFVDDVVGSAAGFTSGRIVLILLACAAAQP